MSASKKALYDFLAAHASLKAINPAASGGKDKWHVFDTTDCLLFMAENYIEEIRSIIGQTDEAEQQARSSGDYSNLVMAYNWNAPEAGMDSIRIPVKLVDALDDKQALMVLRNLEGIKRDIDEGRARKEGLQKLFGDTAHIKTAPNLEGERIYLITGKASASDRRRYAERYAEQVATNVLFDLPKALNAQLQAAVPKESRGRFFIEGRDITARKIRFGADAIMELALIEEGAAVYSDIAHNSPRVAEAVSKLLRRAMTDPFGLSLKYYMGKHAIIKLPSGKPKPRTEG